MALQISPEEAIETAFSIIGRLTLEKALLEKHSAIVQDIGETDGQQRDSAPTE